MGSYQDRQSRIDSMRMKALDNRNALGYLNSVIEGGVEPEDHLLFEQGQVDSILQRRKQITRRRQLSGLERRFNQGRKFDSKSFMGSAGSYNVDNPAAEVPEKRKLLLKCGYTHLTGIGGRRIPLENAKGIRIGCAFRDLYNRHKDN